MTEKMTTAKDLRREKREWVADTFSFQDLKKAGMKPEEIERLHGEMRYGETRYNREYIRIYFRSLKKSGNS